MSTSKVRTVLTILVGLAVAGTIAPRARAQTRVVMPGVPSLASQAINPNFRLAPNLTIGQAAFNTTMAGQALQQVPAFAFGFNPFPRVANFGPTFQTGSPFGIANGGLGLGTGGLGVGGVGASLSTSPLGLGAGGLGSASLSTSGYGGSQASPYSSGYGGYGGYGEDPTAGYLRGTASVIGAQGNFLNQSQQARLLQTQADVSKLDLRRRILEEATLERKNWINPEAERVKDIQTVYSRATHEAPLNEILSGQALNSLYNHVYPLLEKARAQNVQGPNVPLDGDMLKQINLSGAGSLGSVALLKDRGKLTWPLSLQTAAFEPARKEMNTLAAEAVNQVRLNNPVDAATLRDMTSDVRRMNEMLLREVGELSPTDYMQSKHFLGTLDSAIKALQDPGVANQFNQNWAARGRNVAELVDFMGQKGLQFAPATAGDEPAYRHLYQGLVAFDAALGETLTKR
jgi:hypothetical protein